jgi:hypothetical protein
MRAQALAHEKQAVAIVRAALRYTQECGCQSLKSHPALGIRQRLQLGQETFVAKRPKKGSTTAFKAEASVNDPKGARHQNGACAGCFYFWLFSYGI